MLPDRGVMPLFDLALDFATKAHEGQVRKYTGEPYINHPIAVVELLIMKVFNNHIYPDGDYQEKVITAAILHDVVEDTEYTNDHIKLMFGVEVARWIDGLTDKYINTKYPHMNRTERKQWEARRIGTFGPEVHTIKLADLIDNSRSIIQYDERFAKVYLKEKDYLLRYTTKGNNVLQQKAREVVRDGIAYLNAKETIMEFIKGE